MKLYNTLTQSLEEFVPIDNTVRVYVCGITPYDTTHLGHAFLYVSFDALLRYLRSRGYTVKYVQNVTDIDDDILRKSRELGLTWDELGRRETARFLNDMDSLHVARPDVYAKASEQIEMIVEIAQKLIEQGYAYESAGCVYFRVKSDPDFGMLARAIGLQDYQAMLTIANERGNFPDDQRKQDPLDFVLWQAQAPGEPAWESPWGPGRPGWHIECSAMAIRYLGPQIDIHGGGADLAFPHHTCEIAQSEHFTGLSPFSRFWLHIGMVHQDGEKMSKSLGNLTLVSNLLKEHSADAIRLTLLNHHYRYPWECFPADLEYAGTLVRSFQELRTLVGSQATGSDALLQARFEAAMDDDFNTPEAIRLLAEAATDAQANGNHATAAEVLRATEILGLRV
jgi:L-cysteine:1D-myo-inositol 2-amino-2-deoxy-alpha-D-glucopyranoside ligase